MSGTRPARWSASSRSTSGSRRSPAAGPTSPRSSPTGQPGATASSTGAPTSTPIGCRTLGAGPGDAVGISLPRNGELIAAMLGILKAGAAYVPLNPDHPPARLLAQLQLADARALISDAALRGLCGRPPRARRCRARPDGWRGPAAVGVLTVGHRLHPLHLRVDGHPQGRRRHPRQPRQLHRGHDRPPRRRGAALRLGLGGQHRPRQHRDLPGAGRRRLPHLDPTEVATDAARSPPTSPSTRSTCSRSRRLTSRRCSTRPAP